MKCIFCELETGSYKAYHEKCESAYLDRPHICERVGCNQPATQTVYGPGYNANVCQAHYESASDSERQGWDAS